jgi:hypothetical protein
MKIIIDIEQTDAGFEVLLSIGDIVAVIDTHASYSDALDEAAWTRDELGKYPNVRCHLNGKGYVILG